MLPRPMNVTRPARCTVAAKYLAFVAKFLVPFLQTVLI